MEWQDDALVLDVRPHAENDVILSALTLEHGRHAGLVHGGRSRRTAPFLQPGNRLTVTWRARLADHLGSFRVEPARLFAGRLVEDQDRLLALASACALVEAAVPERDPHPLLFAGLLRLLEAMVQNVNWRETYARFELLLLAEMGFALDLASCAITGASEDLVYVSPRTGRAVARDAAGEYAPKLLALPAFLAEGGAARDLGAEVPAALRLTAHFLRRDVLGPADRPLPAVRERLAERLGAGGGEAGATAAPTMDADEG